MHDEMRRKRLRKVMVGESAVIGVNNGIAKAMIAAAGAMM